MRTEPVNILRRKFTELLSTLEHERDPVLITRNGRPAAYLVDVKTFEHLQKRLAILEGVTQGESAIEEGRVLSHAQAKERMAHWLK